MSTMPISCVVENNPETGFKRPFELILVYASGRRRVFSSFKSEEAALSKKEFMDELIAKTEK